MSKLEQLIMELCPDGVPFYELREVFDIKNGYTPSKANASFWENGTIPWFRMEDIRENGRILSDALQYITPKAVKGNLFPANSIIVATSATIGEHALITVESLANQRFTYLMRKQEYVNRIDPMYAYYYCFKLDEWCLNNTNISSFASVDMAKFARFKIPVPPLPVQSEIVRILDNFTELTAELSAELTARKKQYEYYRDLLLTFDDASATILNRQTRITDLRRAVKWFTLEKIADIGTGSSNTNEELEVGEYPFFVRSQEVRRKNTFEYNEKAIITSGDGVGVGKIFHYIEGKYALHQRAYRIHITDERILPKFYFYYMKSAFLPYIEKTSFHSSVTSIRRPMLNNFPVPIPPLEEQERIVEILDRFDALCNDIESGLPAEIEARRKQYEYYRDKLLTFQEVAIA